MSDILSQTADFWQHFYEARTPPTSPSPFATWCLNERHVTPDHHVLELGCGSGRDSFAFIQAGIPTLAVDGSPVAIQQNQQRYIASNAATPARFEALHFKDIATLNTPDITHIYSRFVLHAIPETLENTLLEFAMKTLPRGGRMLHEFRTRKDPLMGKGNAISDDERMTDHYRRFLNFESFRDKLKAQGWIEDYAIESNGLAVFGAEDPVVARIIAVKP